MGLFICALASVAADLVLSLHCNGSVPLIAYRQFLIVFGHRRLPLSLDTYCLLSCERNSLSQNFHTNLEINLPKMLCDSLMKKHRPKDQSHLKLLRLQFILSLEFPRGVRTR